MNISFKHYRYPEDLKDQAILFIPKKISKNALKHGANISKYSKYNSNNYIKESSDGSCALYIPIQFSIYVYAKII